MGYDNVSMFFEGRRDKQLEYFLEFPKGSLCIRFQASDIFRAKQVFAGHTCLMGNVPISLLQIGSMQEVEEYCAKLIKVCGKSGGFILSAGSSIDEAKPENIRAMLDLSKKHRAG